MRKFQALFTCIIIVSALFMTAFIKASTTEYSGGSAAFVGTAYEKTKNIRSYGGCYDSREQSDDAKAWSMIGHALCTKLVDNDYYQEACDGCTPQYCYTLKYDCGNSLTIEEHGKAIKKAQDEWKSKHSH